MHVNGNFDFKGLGKLIRPGLLATDFPAVPTVGELVLKDRNLFVCIAIEENVPYWISLVNELSLHRHDQTVPALEWTIEHGFNTNFPLVQVYDSDGLQVIPSSINCSSATRTTVVFNMPMTGVAVVQSGSTVGLPKVNTAFTETYAASKTWVVTHNLGYNPSITAIVGNAVVQPESIVHDSLLQATITFSSAVAGDVRCV